MTIEPQLCSLAFIPALNPWAESFGRRGSPLSEKAVERREGVRRIEDQLKEDLHSSKDDLEKGVVQ